MIGHTEIYQYHVNKSSTDSCRHKTDVMAFSFHSSNPLTKLTHAKKGSIFEKTIK